MYARMNACKRVSFLSIIGEKSIIFYHLPEDPEMEVPFKFTNAFHAGLKENGKTNLLLRGEVVGGGGRGGWPLCALGARLP